MLAEFILSLTQFILGIVELFIGTRIFLKLFGASTQAPFVRWIYSTSAPLLAPFEGMFPSPELEGLFVIEFSAFFALIFYAFVAYLIQAVVAQITALKQKRGNN